MSDSPWLTVTGGASGTGQGTVNYSVAANPGAGRTGTITAGSAVLTITQSGTSPASVRATGGTPQATGAGMPFAGALQATVLDGNNNPLSGVTVTFAAPASGASASLSGPSAVTNASGVALVTATANSAIGIYDVTASVGPLSAVFVLSNGAGNCDLNRDGLINVGDVQRAIDQALGTFAPSDDLDGDRVWNVLDVQMVANAALQLGCAAK